MAGEKENGHSAGNGHFANEAVRSQTGARTDGLSVRLYWTMRDLMINRASNSTKATVMNALKALRLS